MDEIATWYKGIPTITKFLFTNFVVITLAGYFVVIIFGPRLYGIFWYSPFLIFTKFQIWRFYTAFFYVPFGFDLKGLSYVFQAYFLYRHSLELETSRFAGRKADYIYFLLVEAGLILILGWYIEYITYHLSECLIMAIIYLWSQEFRDTIVTFLFGIRFKGAYFPWVLLAFELIQMQNIWPTAIGILSGHIYYYLMDLYPAAGGPRLLNTPRWLYRYFPPLSSGARTSFGTAFSARNQNTAGEGSTHKWGRGRRLGSS
ncbi:2193_t:CDS:2 [Cetraspora pellucida]|uniref:Derlin n=1 Tax=Cetraspora pellucida TaxID=1433469 RepID=A0A9N9F578_9GLOM|nr:2193_t:CDS:2 [Cetraspora pellucida]